MLTMWSVKRLTYRFPFTDRKFRNVKAASHVVVSLSESLTTCLVCLRRVLLVQFSRLSTVFKRGFTFVRLTIFLFEYYSYFNCLLLFCFSVKQFKLQVPQPKKKRKNKQTKRKPTRARHFIRSYQCHQNSLNFHKSFAKAEQNRRENARQKLVREQERKILNESF